MGDQNGSFDNEGGPPRQGPGTNDEWADRPDYLYAGAPDDEERPAQEQFGHVEPAGEEEPEHGLTDEPDGFLANPWPESGAGATVWPDPGDSTRVDPPAGDASSSGPPFGQRFTGPPRPVPVPGGRRTGPPADTTVLPLGAVPGGPVPPGGGPRRTPPRPNGPRQARQGRRRTRPILIALAILGVIVLIALAMTGTLSRLLGFGSSSPSTSPSVTNSASGGTGTQGTPSQGASSGGGIAMPSGTPSATGSANASASSSSAPAIAGGSPSAGATATPSVSASAGTVCVTTRGWNTKPQVTAQLHRQVPIVSSDAAPHGNCDRTVFTLKGDHSFRHGAKVGINASYVTSATTDPRGTPIDLEGHPAIKLVIMAPSELAVSNGYVISPSQIQAFAAKAGGPFSQVRWVKYGGSFEGQTTLIISVQAEHPFAAFSSVDAQGNIFAALDVANLANGDVVKAAPSSSDREDPSA